jgi:CBS domain-containing protein
VIVRIMGEGQYRLTDEVRARVNDLDNECVAAVERSDAEGFSRVFAQLLELVRSEGQHLADDELEPSEVIVPPPDTSMEEAAREFSGDGLIPEPAASAQKTPEPAAGA